MWTDPDDDIEIPEDEDNPYTDDEPYLVDITVPHVSFSDRDYVIAVQVTPVIETDLEFTLQPEGPTEATTGWAVLLVREVTGSGWEETYPEDGFAVMYAMKLAWENGVDIEQQPWMPFKKPKPWERVK